MIGKNWMKGLAVASAAVIAGASVPLVGSASTHYTGTTPQTISMMSAAGVTPLKKVSTTKHKSKHLLHKTALKKAAVKTTKLHKKHVAVTAKKKHTA